MSTRAKAARPSDAAGREAWTVLQMILWSADYLQGKGVESGRLDAEHLLARAVGVERLRLYLDFERPLDATELDAYRPLLQRRARREPLQYILGRQPFRELDLEVTPAVLVPRPETEVLVDLILEWVRESGRADPTALDVGTGSGAIALSLAFEGGFARVLATDVDEDALEVAHRNRAAVELEADVELGRGPLFDPVPEGERFDVVASNPPYVAETESEALQPEVGTWEPRVALFGGPDGLDVIREIIAGAASVLEPGGLLALEVGVGQARGVAEMVEGTAGYRCARVRRDYSGRERFVLAEACT